MANIEVIIQIMFISLAMVGFSTVLNKIMGLNMDAAREIREKSKNLQERMRTVRLTGDVQQMAELQQESMILTKLMMRKQMIPSCVRCIIFMGIFAVIGFVYVDYADGLFPFPILIFGSGWFAAYFLFSIGFSLVLYLIKRLYRKLTGKEDMRKMKSREILGMFSSQSGNQQGNFQLTRQIPDSLPRDYNSELEQEESGEQPESDSWKDRIQK